MFFNPIYNLYLTKTTLNSAAMKEFNANLICFFSFILLLSCNAATDTTIGTPKIEAGTAKIKGKVICPEEKIKDSSVVKIFVPHPVSGELFEYKATIDHLGRFSIDIDVETDISLIALYTSLKPYNSLYVKVKSGGATDINIIYGQNMEIEDVKTNPPMRKTDMMGGIRLINEMLGIYDSFSEPQIPLYDKSPEAYLDYIKTRVSEKLKILTKDSLVSTELKEILARDFRLWRYNVGAFDYERSMIYNFKLTAKDTTIMPKIQKIDRSYFRFLKDFDLNNPQNLICSSFSNLQKETLQNKILAIPEIAELDIPSWLARVKAILSDVVGFKDGQYYDILAANAYGKQLSQDARPLTEQQKKNIAAYWKDGEIAKILLRKNQQVVDK